MSNLQFVAHVSGTVGGAVLTVGSEMGAQFARSAKGVYTVTVSSADKIDRDSLKATLAFNGPAIGFGVDPTSSTVTTLNFFDAAGLAEDPVFIACTLERVMFVG